MKKLKQEKHSLIKEVRKKKKKEMMAKAATDYMNNKLHIENKYASLISLIDTIYPPLLCTLCDTVSTSRAASNIHFNEKHKKKSRYLCIHPHCDQSFLSRGALRFHISRSHLVNYSKKPLPDPPFLNYNGEPIMSSPMASPSMTATPLSSSSPAFDKSPSPPPAPVVAAPPPTVAVAPSLPATTTSPTTPTTPTTTTTTTISPTTKKKNSPLTTNNNNHIKKQPYNKISPKKEKVFTPTISSLLIDDLTPSPPPSPFSLYHPRKNSPKKPTLSAAAESFLNSMYPPLQCPACQQIFNRKTNVIKHLTEAHLGQEPYRCIYPECAHPRLYATREGLIYHIVRLHDDDEQQKSSPITTTTTTKKVVKKK